MKKLIGSLMVVLALVCFTSIGYAADKGSGSRPTQAEKAPRAEATCAVTLLGKIVSIDKTTNEVVVKDQYDKLNKTIVVKPDVIKKLKVGETASFGLSASTAAENVNIVNPEKVKSK